MDIPRAIQFLRPDAIWSLNGESYNDLQWRGPGNPPTLAELEAAWQTLQAVKIWPNVQAFMAAFTMPEKGAIALSMDPTIAALRLELTTWLSDVHSNDPRVVAGLDKLVELGILTTERKNTILS